MVCIAALMREIPVQVGELGIASKGLLISGSHFYSGIDNKKVDPIRIYCCLLGLGERQDCLYVCKLASFNLIRVTKKW